ncbi:hypothetical protein F5884DRAFT_882157 [Xylogone sp. PMI_703]|nr:hypothetical protein F5884DRAFT_882157 [Xylogone sp. PMI_703]
MPLINGLKMACEPCIRGHRSTKCTHANERLMVPVRKPGRPLSACPHPRDQACSCGRLSVTAAIPKKQKCRCGDDAPTPVEKPSQTEQPELTPADLPSPTRTSFKVQKTSKPAANRKQSFDASKLQRMDINNINILPFEQRLQNIQSLPNSGVPTSEPLQQYDLTQFVNIDPSYGQLPLQNYAQFNNFIPNGVGMDVRNGFSSTSLIYGSNFSGMVESPMLTKSNDLVSENKNTKSNGGSCCAPKATTSNDTLSNAVPLSEQPKEKSCCSSAPAVPGQMVVKQESIEVQGTPNGVVPNIPQQFSHNENTQTNTIPQYLAQSVFAYPATYGSYQHPLQPFQWRQTAKANSQAQAQGQAYLSPELQFHTPLLQHDVLDSFHTCHCGDSCQCIGCAAHPYNEATQNYIRSAYSSMIPEQQSSSKDLYSNTNSPPNGHSNSSQSPTNGNTFSPTVSPYSNGQAHITDPIPSPQQAAQTPGSNTHSPGPHEEQTLSASDFFFVSYPFASDGCGGDTVSCPCGDDCQCLGCTIHRSSDDLPCPGDKDSCPCVDDCECVGCTIHKAKL